MSSVDNSLGAASAGALPGPPSVAPPTLLSRAPSRVQEDGTRAARVGSFAGVLAPVLVFSFAVALGGFESGARALPTTLGVLVLAFVAAFGASRNSLDLLDPLALGESSFRRARLAGLLPWLVLVGLAASWWLSPVSRSGRMLLCYGPWLLLVVPAVRASLRTEDRRRVAEPGFSLAVIVVASWALFDWLVLGSPRAAMPLGHHNLLALWLVAMLPMAVLPAVWRDGESLQQGLERGVSSSKGGVPLQRPTSTTVRTLGTVAAALGLLALLGTGSLAGAVGLSVQLLWIVSKAPGPQGSAVRRRRVLYGVLSSGAILLAVGWRRFAALLGEGDQSMEARWLYLRAGLDGWLERPLLGWGPGASSWTLGLHLDSGKLPVHQIVTDTHSLIFDLLYEGGAVGLGAVALLVWWWCRARGKADRDSGLQLEAKAWRSVSEVSLLGIGVMALVAGFFDVLAVWILVPVLVGVRGSAERQPTSSQGWFEHRRWRVPLVAIVVCLLGWNSLGPLRSQFAYERAMWTSDPAVKRTALKQAVRLDAAHPLVRIEKARLEGAGQEALLAAEQARGLSPLFLAAGYLLRGSEDRSMKADAQYALTVACDLAVGDPLAPFFLATLQDPGEALVEGRDLQALARALVAEPRLLVTPELLARPDIREAAVRLLEHRVEIPIGWRAALVESESRLPQGTHAVEDPLDLVLYAEESRETSLALFAFRRTALPTVLARLTLDRTLASTITMPPAADLGEFDPQLFAQGCRLEATRAEFLSARTSNGRL